MNIAKTLTRAVVATVLLIVSIGANALDAESYTDERFKELQEDNALVLIDIFATWCSTCAKQEKILAKYFEENPDSEIKVLRVDFDDQKEVVTKFRAPRQSTFYLYRGEEQLWFSVAEKRKKVIFKELAKAESK